MVAVVAAHSTGEGGEVRPKRPTGGKAPSGRAFNGQTHERDSALTNRVTRPPLDCIQGQQKLCLRNRMRELRTYGSVGGPDGQPSALPGRLHSAIYLHLEHTILSDAALLLSPHRSAEPQRCNTLG